MATSGTTSFALQVDEIIEEALLRIGGEPQIGKEVQSARRSMNLIFRDWFNRGILLWATDEVEQTLANGTTSYTLDSATVDILEAVLQTTTSSEETDMNITRISREDYLEIPNKNSKGKPSQYFIDRLRSAPVVYLYPTPDDAYVFKYRRSKKLEDIDASYQDVDVPDRFYPCLISGLSYYMSLKRPQIDPQRRQELKLLYEEEFDRAITEEREKVDLQIMPQLSYV